MKDQEYDYFYDDEQDAKYCYPDDEVVRQINPVKSRASAIIGRDLRPNIENTFKGFPKGNPFCIIK